MRMKKQLISSVACLLLCVIMFLGSTLAWFSDNSGSVNTMVSGKISIEQVITDAEGNPFVNDKFILVPTQTVTKKVTVKNTGNQPCYVRTLFAFEDKVIDDPKTVDVVETVVGYLTLGDNKVVIPGVTDTTVPKVQFEVTENGVTTLYTVGYSLYDQPLGVDDDEFVSLNTVTLQAAAGNEWSEAVDNTYELLVLSQATQVAGLDNLGANGTESPAEALDKVFGDINGDNSGNWFGNLLD